ARFRELGKNVYLWDRHTVKPRAAVSYVTCLLEIMQQAAAENITPSAIYVCSAGSTGVGLALGAKALGWNVPVISVAPIIWPWDTRDDMAQIAKQTAELLGISTRLTRDDIDVTEDYIGPGYG